MPKHPKRSRYDELHDRFEPILTGKAGTRYERLAAMVWKILHEQNAVVHDVKVVGGSDVAHQIDVRMERGGEAIQTLLECKDFDVRGAPVGLSVMRDFRSVLEDTGMSEGIVVTCNSFTRDARKYAKAKGIKLVVLRIFEDVDMTGRIGKFIVNFHVAGVIDMAIDNLVLDEAGNKQLTAQLAAIGAASGINRDDEVFFVKDGVREHFITHLGARANGLAKGKGPGTWTDRVFPEGWSIQVGTNPPIPFDHIDLRYNYAKASETLEVTSKRVAELLVSGFGGADIIIYGDELERRQISDDGEVL